MADHVVYTGFDPEFGDRLNRLIALAKAQGYTPNLISGTRSAYGWPGMKGQSQAELYSQLGTPGGPKAAAAPGNSPHQYGLASDVTGIPQSELERLSPQVGLRAIHSDPNHVELANWQQEAATQPQMTAWDQTNPANVPTRMAMNMEGGGPPASQPPGTTLTSNALLDTMRENVGQYESGNNYNILGKRTNTGDQAVGKYQVMKSNIPGWTQKWLGHSMTPDQFRADPQAQDAVFNGEFGSYLQNYSPADAASKWFTGGPLSQAGNKRDILGTTAPAYVAATTKGIDNPYALGASPNTTTAASAPTPSAGGAAAPAAPGAPAPAQGNWMTKLASALKPQDKGAGSGGGEDQPPDFRLNPVAPAQAAGGGMMMGAGGQNTFGRNAAEQGLAQQGFMLQPSLAAFNAYNPPSPIGAPPPGGAPPGSAEGMPAMPGTTLNSPSQLQMALMSGSINPYDLYARAGMGAGGFGST